MNVIGRDLSPFVRRVMVSLKLTGLPHSQSPFATGPDIDKIRAVNPLARMPALQLGEDEPPLIDSWAILDHIDEQAGPAKALVPPKGAQRREVLRLTAFGTGVMEKAVASFSERTRRPADKLHPPYRDQVDGQVTAGLGVLDEAAGKASAQGWPYLTGSKVTQADVTAAVALDFIRFTAPYQLPDSKYPHLSALATRLSALPAFRETSLERFK